ncbi:heterokaryon incompatibility protein, partial [Colletotrichum incanum]
LDQVAIPTPKLLEACPHLSFVDLPDPGNTKWLYLSQFNVVTEAKDAAYIQELEVLCQLPITSGTLEEVRRIYRYLAQSGCNFWHRTRDTFLDSNKKLVYHPSRGWVPLRECVWEGPNALKNATTLTDVYPECCDFFQKYLNVQDSGIPEAIEELKRLSNIPGNLRELEVMKSIILILCDYLAKGRPSGQDSDTKKKDEVRRLRIFPMMKSALHSHDSDGTVYKSLDDTWYIADRTTLKSAFLGKVQILDFDVKYVDQLLPLINWLGLEKIRLSEAVDECTISTGSAVLQHDWLVSMQKRVKFLFLLVNCWLGDRAVDELDTNLPPVDVWKVTGLDVRRTIGDVQGESGHGLISITETDSRINVFVLRHPFENSPPQVDVELPTFFMRWCSIKDAAYFQLVSLILRTDLNEIRGLLEDHNIRCPFSEDTDMSDDCVASVAEKQNEIEKTKSYDMTVPSARLGIDRVTDASILSSRFTAVTDTREDAIAQTKERFKDIGRQAEAYVDGFFKRRIPDWDSKPHWTSHLREDFGHPGFLGNESTTATFTYTDEEGKHMFSGLQKLGIFQGKQFHHAVTYHFEVKGTVFGCDEAFHLSQKQMELARKYALKYCAIPTDVFITVRVYNVEKKPTLKFYLDPWTNIFKGKLFMTASDSAYIITPLN